MFFSAILTFVLAELLPFTSFGKAWTASFVLLLSAIWLTTKNRSLWNKFVVSIALCGCVLALSGCGGSQSSTKPLPLLTSIAVTPANTTISVGKNQQFAASGTFSDGSTADITPSVIWSSSDMKLASVNSSGLVSAVDLGRPQITASSGSLSGSTPLIIVMAATPAVARFAYVTGQDYDPPNFNGTISTYTVNPGTGQLRQSNYTIAGPVPGPVTVEPRNKFAYVPNGSFAIPSGINMISVFSIDPANGGLATLPGSPFPTSEMFLTRLVVEPRGKFLYTGSSSGDVLAFTIDQSTGALTAAVTPTATGTSLELIATDPSGAFLYVASFDRHLYGFKIDPATGVLTPVPGSPFLGGGTDITVDPSGHFLYAVDGDIVYAFAIDSATGALKTLPSSFNTTSDTSSAGITMDTGGKFLYVTHDYSISDPNNYISVFSIDSDGGVTQQASHFPTSEVEPASIKFDPTGKFLYVSEAGSVVEVFSVASSGALSSAGLVRTRSSVKNEITLGVGSTAVSYLPTFAYVADAGSNDVTAYSINAASGTLTSAGTVIAANPSSVAVDPLQRSTYVTRLGDNSVGTYSLNATTGGLTATGTVAAGSSPSSVAVDPSGRFVYAANSVSNDVSMYMIDANTGKLTSIGTLAAGTTPVALAIDPTGQFVLVANQGSSDVSVYSIDVNTGVLTSNGPLDPTTNPTLPNPDPSGRTSIAFDPSGRLVYVGAQSGSVLTYISSVMTPFFVFAGITNAGTSPIILAADPSGPFGYAGETNSNTIHIFSINSTSGALNPAGTIATGQAPVSLAVESSGKFAYAANKTSNNISIYSVDASTGILTSAGTVPAGNQPVCIVTTATIQ
jgi:6-phosphogluconolactonase (cycloisomerase 2 family)